MGFRYYPNRAVIALLPIEQLQRLNVQYSSVLLTQQLAQTHAQGEILDPGEGRYTVLLLTCVMSTIGRSGVG